jgi:cytochrome c551
MIKLGTFCLLAGLLLTGSAACGGATNQTVTPGQPTSAAPLPSVSPTGDGGGVGTATPSSGAGRQIFAANCAGCHGSDGSGGFGPDIRNVNDLTRVQKQVTNGGAQMPAFNDQLTPAQIKAVSQYVAHGFKT